MSTPVLVARCPVHGLHGQRSECFVCGGPVEQVPMLPLDRVGRLKHSPDIVLQSAREYAAEGRESHVLWAEHLRAHPNGASCDACTDAVVATAGDLETQLEWVRKYDVILAALGFVDETLAVRLVDAVARIGDEVEREQRLKNARHALRYRAEARR